ncbi:GNAT family N-acetyltransferase [Rubellimicrobium aerolatum]|uniref:GNAT family N-acetyltransferase n=1 Tax=Rubellimicrobium aerolatum TaxID=490979 RepID=A0ABW0S8J2_9RHOB|nr:GNAT family N-acetyltransferase [Rubellimicrobium aerolatum]MBP1804209.1 GNAT superfamily N-acetyltransferase [Rubellimicrobium aerolatum]
MPGTLISAPLSAPRHHLEESEDIDLLRSHLKVHYRSLGPRSRRLRFMGDPSVEALDRLADRADPELVLELVEEGAVRAMLEAHASAPGHVEVAISVEDRYQGKGLGRALFEEGLVILAARGFRTADLVCLRENTALLHLVSRAGARMRMEDGEVQIAIELDHVLDHVRLSAAPAPAAGA